MYTWIGKMVVQYNWPFLKTTKTLPLHAPTTVIQEIIPVKGCKILILLFSQHASVWERSGYAGIVTYIWYHFRGNQRNPSSNKANSYAVESVTNSPTNEHWFAGCCNSAVLKLFLKVASYVSFQKSFGVRGPRCTLLHLHVCPVEEEQITFR